VCVCVCVFVVVILSLFVSISAVVYKYCRERIVSEAINLMLNYVLALVIHYDRNMRSFVYN